MEQAAMHALAELIADGERTVGSVIEIVHGAPSPIGARVVVSARVQSVEGRKVWFAVEASDESGRVASGRHARFVVDDARFQARLARPRTNRDGNE
jgi:predicted thioesterase